MTTAEPPVITPRAEIGQSAGVAGDAATFVRGRLSEWIDRYDRSPLAESDVMGVQAAAARTWLGLMSAPGAVSEVFTRWSVGIAQAWSNAWAIGVNAALPGSAIPGAPLADKRFADPAWSINPVFSLLREQYEQWARAVDELVDAAGLAEKERRKVRFIAAAMVDALAPTNFAATNPAVIKRAIETGGASVLRGFQNYVQDLVSNNGRPRQLADGAFQVGRDLAVTPGKVVVRNDLMELIQYAPATETVYEVPLLLSPPWINKYYVMDLAPGRSFVEWAVQHGHTVFVISYRNPDQSMRGVSLDDYLLWGPRAALDVITEITGAEKVNLLGLCLGGTLTMATLAHLDATGDDRINSATFLNTLIDFDEPGILGVTTGESTIAKLEASMAETGFLPAQNMSRTFDMLRANDLVWNYVVNNWLMGQDPPAFDILSWNADSTRMPANMHSFYLRSCYLENELARGEMTLAGQRLDLGSVDQDMYFLAAEQDHIAPWRSSYAGALLPSGKVRFVLSNAGHIAGIVNPPHPKSRHWVNEGPLHESPDEWLAGATLHATTWWEDWAGWIGDRAGGRRTPPPMGSERHPPLADAPGTYVLAK